MQGLVAGPDGQVSLKLLAFPKKFHEGRFARPESSLYPEQPITVSKPSPKTRAFFAMLQGPLEGSLVGICDLGLSISHLCKV